MSLRLILIHSMYRIVFGVGIATLLWVGGHLVCAKAYQLYAMSKSKNDPDMTIGPSDIQALSLARLRSRNSRPRLDSSEREVAGQLAGLQETIPLSSGDGNFTDAVRRNAFVRELQHIHVGDTIQLSTPRGTFGYFVTTIEVVDPSESPISQSTSPSELIIVTTPPVPFVGAVPEQFVVHARPQSGAKN